MKKKCLISVTSVCMALLMILLSITLPVGAASETITDDSTAQAAEATI